MSASFRDVFYQATDGLRLHARMWEAESGNALPVVCLPGLSRNVRDFHELALFLSRQAGTARTVIAFDYRGRGESARDPDWTHYTVGVEAADVLTGLDALQIGRGAFIGTSRGGLIIHVLGALRPQILGPIVLNDIGPKIEPEGLEHIRSYLGASDTPSSFEDAAIRLQAVHGPAFPALTEADWNRFARAIYREVEGKLVPDFDPALLNGLAALDLTRPLPSLWEQFDLLAGRPLLTIRGANSLLLSQATVDEMARRHPGMEVEIVRGQGHAPLLETGGLPQRIAAFLDRAESSA